MALSLDDLRSHFGNKDASDEEVILEASKRYKAPPQDIAADLGVPLTGGKWGNVTSAAVDTSQAQLWDTTESVAGHLGLNNVERIAKQRRKQNEAEAELASGRAQALGMTSNVRDIRGAGDVGEFIGGTAIGSGPQMAAGFAGATAGASAGAAIGSVVPVVGTAVGGAIGGALGYGAASLPYYFGSKRQAQREQTRDLPGGERVDDASALSTALVDTGLDMLGGGPVSGVIRRGATKLGTKLVGETAETAAKDVVEEGAKKVFGLKSMGKDVVVGGAKEAAFSEVPQQVSEEYARRAVDPTHDLLGSEAVGRYVDATAGAFGLGGTVNLISGAAGRATIGAKSDPDVSKTDVPAGVPGSKYGLDPAGMPATGPAREAPSDAVLPKTSVDNVNAAMPVPGANAAAAAEAASAPAPTAEETKEAERMRGVKERVEAATSLTDKAVAYGVDPKHLTEFAALTTAVNENEIDEETFQSSVAALASGNPSLIAEVKKAIAAVNDQYSAKLEAKTAAEAEAAAAPAPEPALGVQAIEEFRKPDGTALSALEKDRLFLMLGLDEDGTPTGERLYPKDVALIESQTTNKKVSKQAIGDPLSRLGFDNETINRLYKQIHGVEAGLEGDTGLEDVAADEGEKVRDATQRDKVTDSDQSELQGALGAEDTGESGHMRITSSANANVAVEEATLQQRRKEALQALAKAPEYTDEQRAAIKNALAEGADKGATKDNQSGKAARDKLIKNKLFSEEQQNVIEQLLAHGDTLRAMEARAARVASVVERRKGVQTEHEKQVRMRQAAEQLAREEAEEQARIEKKAREEDLFDEGEEAIEGDARTLRIMLMQGTDTKETAAERRERRARGEISRQERLIGPSLSDAKVTWAMFALKYSGKPETALPAWDELTPTEQAAFVRTVDYHANESKEGEDAESAIDAKTQELADTKTKRDNAAKERAAKEAEKAKPEFKEKLIAQEKGEVKKIIEEGGKAAAGRKRVVAERKAKKAVTEKEKPNGNQGAERQDTQPTVVGGGGEAQGQQGAGGPVGGPDGQEVQRSGPDAAGKEVPQVGAADTADATAGAAHGPGPVRGADGQAAAGAGTEGDAGDVGTSDVMLAPAVRASLEAASTPEPIEYGVELENGKWVTLEEAVESALLALSPRERESGASYGTILGIQEAHWDDVAFATNDAAEGETAQNIERLIVARNASPAPLTVTASAGTQQEGGVPRAPSVTRVVRSSRNALDAGKMSPEAFAATTSAALDAADAARAAKGRGDRLRGGDRVMEQLLAARRAGVLSPEGVEIAMWLIRQNPQAVRTLGMSIRAAGINEDTMSGEYNPATRIATLIKGSLNVDTATHEILHHLERVMPPRMQAAIRRAWTKQLSQAYKSAQKASNPNLAKYYTALMDYHFGRGDPKALDAALDLLHEGKVGYEHYSLFNPSEFWATNGSRIVTGRYGVSGTVLGQIKQYIKEFVQTVKNALGLKSDHAVLAALNSIAQSDGTFTSGMMLQDQPGVHFMYAGEKTQDQEALSQLQMYGFWMSSGATAEKARLATGWFRGVDNEMRYELSDHDAEFTTARPPERMKIASFYDEPTTYRLEDVLDHPALYEAYPDAKDILVTRQASDQDGKSRVQGWFNPDKNLVNITPYAKNPLSTLVHELQHWVQVKEGFAVGGSPEIVVAAMSETQRADLYGRARAEMDQPGFTQYLDPAQREQLEQLLNAGDNPDALSQYAAGTEAIINAYKAIAGEIEARDTQKRMGLTPEQRKGQTPYTSEKIASKDVVRLMRPSGIAMDVGAQQQQRYRNLEVVRSAAVARVPRHARPAVDTLSRMVINSSKKLIRGLTFTRDLLQMAAKGLPSATKYLGLEEARNAAKIAHEHKADKIVAGYKKLGTQARAQLNAYIKKSTMTSAWGYQPEWLFDDESEPVKVKIDDLTRDAWKALSKEQQQIVDDVFKHGHETLREMKDLVNKNVANEFEAAIASATAAGDEKTAAKLDADMKDQLEHFKTLLKIGEYNPYSPLKRFGNHVVVGKSQAYLDAVQAMDENPDDTKLATAVRELAAQPAHYFVAMRETQHEAQQLADQIRDQYQESYSMEKDRGYVGEIGGNRGMLGMFHRLRGQAEREDDGVSKKAKAATDRMLTDLYLSLLSETSARQSERERKNVAGAEDDMMRAFHSKARADANFLASLATAGDMQNTLQAMEREADKRGDVNGVSMTERHEHYREILSRHIQSMDYKQSPMVDSALAASSVMQLLTSPAYHLTNMLQPYVMSAPTLAGRFGMARSLAEMATAHKQLGKQLFKNGVDHSTIKDLPSDVQKGVQALMDRGFINMSLDTEHGANWNDGPLGKILSPMKKFSERVETVNRVATGVAALRLATKAGMSEQAAQDYAAKIIYDTHGDYSGFNTPAVMRSPVARLVTQYRKFQLIQIHNYARMMHDSFANANLSKEEQWVARKALAYNLSTMFALGGTLGLPGAQAIGAILRVVFGDDDEPDDPETTMRKYLADAGLEGVSDLLVKGVPAWLGVDVSGRMGAGTILSLFPNADTSKGIVSRDAFENYALAATGPFIGGLMPKLADGMQKFSNGDIYASAESLMPNGVGNMLKGARIATQGVTDTKGNTVMDPEQVSALAGLGQMAGFPTTTVTERSRRAQALRTMDLFYKEKVSQIKRDYVEAYRSGDADKLAEARSDFADMQARMKAHDLPPAKLSDLIKAPHEQAKKDRAMVAGVPVTKRTAAAAQQLADIYD